MTSKQLITAIGVAASLTAGAVVSDAQIQAQDVLINPYTENVSALETRVNGNLVEIDKNTPKVTLHKWNGEDSLGVLYSKIKPGAKTSRQILTKIAKYDVSKDESVVMEPTDDGEGFNIDINLNSKPTSNVFTYQFENWVDKEFVYQPPLNAGTTSPLCTETDCNGSYRPVNVVGSYAVYSLAHYGHESNGTNYETGKMLHIYRPLVSDASGSSTWATLSYDAGVLSVIVPQAFLDSAVYPVLVDPTFGFITIGATWLVSGNIFCQHLGDISINLSQAVMPQAGTVNYLSLYQAMNNTLYGTENFKPLIYSDNSNYPDSLVATGSPIVLPNTTTFGWRYAPISKQLNAGTYWIGGVCDSSGSDPRVPYDTGGLSLADDYITDSYSSPNTPYPSSRTTTSTKFSMYISYTATSSVMNYPGTVVDDNSVGTPAWSNPSNATSTNGAYAFSNPGTTAGSPTHYLKATNFGFSIPSGSTINGVQAEIQAADTAACPPSSTDNIVKLVKGGTVQGNNLASTVPWSCYLTWRGYGSSTEMWGLSLTDTDVNASNFGIVLSVASTACFPAGTEISTPFGKKKIEDIQDGDFVYSWDEKIKMLVPKKVIKTIKTTDYRFVEVTTTDGTVDATLTHPFLTDHGYVEAQNLNIGDIVYKADGNVVKKSRITALGHKEHLSHVYNFEVEDTHNYVANGFIVHNPPGCNSADNIDAFRMSIFYSPPSGGGTQVQSRVMIIQ